MNESIRILPSYYGEHDNTLETKGCYSFAVANKGSVRAYLWGVIELEPGQQESFDNINGLPYGENVKLDFAKADGEKRVLLTLAIKSGGDPCGE